MRVNPELGGSCGDASVHSLLEKIFVVLLLLRGDGPILVAAREIFVVPETFAVLAVLIRVFPSACWTTTALPSSVPAFLRDLTAGCWSRVEIRVRVLQQSI